MYWVPLETTTVGASNRLQRQFPLHLFTGHKRVSVKIFQQNISCNTKENYTEVEIEIKPYLT